MSNAKKVIFVDRDGTIIREPDDEQIDSLEKLSFVPGAIAALRAITDSDYELVMVTNQDGLGTDSFPEETFLPAHNKMIETLEGEGVKFNAIYIDRTFEHENAPTRKPRIGMLTRYLSPDYNLKESYVIGDRLTDLQLARNLGAKGILLGQPVAGMPAGSVAIGNWTDIATHVLTDDRRVSLRRTTSETDISLTLDLDGHIESHIDTGLKFFDHMLNQLPHHAGIGLQLTCKGDLEVDEHHTMEDVAIVLGEAIDKALGSKRGIDRYGFVLPMDESRAMTLIDFGGRAELVWDVKFTREYVGDTPTEMFHHFFKSLSTAMKANLYISARGENNHHLIEGVFKALARAIKMAVRRAPFNYSLPSSKGLL